MNREMLDMSGGRYLKEQRPAAEQRKSEKERNKKPVVFQEELKTTCRL
jgi:hypothetical protein